MTFKDLSEMFAEKGRDPWLNDRVAKSFWQLHKAIEAKLKGKQPVKKKRTR